MAGYAGPHRIVLNRNQNNVGIGAHLSQLAARAEGELLFVAAGDDISLPQRCAAVVAAWEQAGRKPDLICGELIDMDWQGRDGETIRPDDLASWHGFDDWAHKKPYVVGAAHTLVAAPVRKRFGPMRPHLDGEDLVMTFRAIMSGGAISLRQPLVRYRRGGLTRGRRQRTPRTFIAQVLRSNRSGMAETAQLLDDAAVAGVAGPMRQVLAWRQARELYLREIFTAQGLAPKLKLLFGRGGTDPFFRLRFFLYAACPWLYAPFFFLKGLVRR